MAWITKSFLRDGFFSIDTRTLGFTRIAIGLMLFFDLAKRSTELTLWFTDEGLIPNAMLAEHPLRPYGESIFFYVDTVPEVRLAFVLVALIYLCFLVGLFTRVMHVLAWVCLISLHIRTDVLANGGDYVFGDLVLWTAFLPLGATFSVDASRRKRAGKPPMASPHVSVAVFVALFQLAIIYFFNAIHKGGVTWRDGTAVYWLAQQERIVTFAGYWMRENLPLWVFQGLTYGTLVIEFLLGFLILSPWGKPWTRRLSILGILALHLGIALVSNVGLFSFVMIAYSTLLISKEDWDWLRDRVAARRGESARLVSALTLPKEGEPTAPASRWRWAAMPVLAFLVVVATSQVLIENPSIARYVKHEQPEWIRASVMRFRLNQGWKMFAANAPRDDAWIVVDAITEDGRHVDPMNEVASRHADPSLREIPPYLGLNYFWCDYIARIKGFRMYYPGLTDWIYNYHERTGNDADRIVSFRAYQITHIPPAPGEEGPHDVKAKPFLRKRRPRLSDKPPKPAKSAPDPT
ncbi:MAG: HTTM domain-containing protein [Myxococcota bacterium]